MSECPKCQTPCEPGDRFCSQCGERLEVPELSGEGARTQKALSLSDVHYNLGMVYFKKGEYHKALEYWEKGIRQDPGNAFLQKCITEAREKIQQAG